MRKGEIPCYKQFFLFLHCFPQLYIFSVSKYGIVWLKVIFFSVHRYASMACCVLIDHLQGTIFRDEIKISERLTDTAWPRISVISTSLGMQESGIGTWTQTQTRMIQLLIFPKLLFWKSLEMISRQSLLSKLHGLDCITF